MSDRYWKVLDEHGRACHGGHFVYDLPRWDARRGWIPGAWTPAIVDLAPCARGYHVCRDEHLLDWPGSRICACEVRGAQLDHDNKVVVEQVRLTALTPWDETSARLFAVECAASALPFYERDHPGDTRPAEAVEAAFLFALGHASAADLAAARDAAWAAARDAAGAAAWGAARDAARAAAGNAAWDAAGAAAWDAARDAGDAARDAAWAAAWDAAWAAAWDAARKSQTERLLWWLGA